MQWWNDLITWVNSDAGWRVVSTAVIPFVAIIIAGLIGIGAARGGASRAIGQQNSERAAAAVGAMIHAGRDATRWASLPQARREHIEVEFITADVQLRLLPLNGSSAAADWATHELGSMRRDSASFTFQAEQTYVEFRDRLLEWQRHPGRARKLFALDLERFGLEDQTADAELVERQRRWAAEEAAAAAGLATPDLPDDEPAPVRAVPYTATAIAPEAVAEPALAEPAAAEEPAPAPVPSYLTPPPAAPATWSLHAPTVTVGDAAPTTASADPAPLVVSTPVSQPAVLVEPSAPDDATPPQPSLFVEPSSSDDASAIQRPADHGDEHHHEEYHREE